MTEPPPAPGSALGDGAGGDGAGGDGAGAPDGWVAADGRLDPGLVARARDCLRGGGVVLLPTDTVYGLAVHPDRPEAADRLFAMKRRPRSRNLPVMVAHPEDLTALGVELTGPARRLIAAFVPGPLSLALGVTPGAAPEWLAGRDEVAVRVPDDPATVAILEATGPLLVTSANLHQQSTPESVGPILASLAGRPDLVIDGGVRRVVPSTLVNCHVPEPVIERAGAVAADEIERVLS